jgi:hypothetical protein
MRRKTRRENRIPTPTGMSLRGIHIPTCRTCITPTGISGRGILAFALAFASVELRLGSKIAFGYLEKNRRWCGA